MIDSLILGAVGYLAYKAYSSSKNGMGVNKQSMSSIRWVLLDTDIADEEFEFIISEYKKVRKFFGIGNRLPNQAEFDEFKLYLKSKLMAQPYIDGERILKEEILTKMQAEKAEKDKENTISEKING